MLCGIVSFSTASSFASLQMKSSQSSAASTSSISGKSSGASAALGAITMAAIRPSIHGRGRNRGAIRSRSAWSRRAKLRPVMSGRGGMAAPACVSMGHPPSIRGCAQANPSAIRYRDALRCHQQARRGRACVWRQRRLSILSRGGTVGNPLLPRPAGLPGAAVAVLLLLALVGDVDGFDGGLGGQRLAGDGEAALGMGAHLVQGGLVGAADLFAVGAGLGTGVDLR